MANASRQGLSFLLATLTKTLSLLCKKAVSFFRIPIHVSSKQLGVGQGSIGLKTVQRNQLYNPALLDE